MIAGVIMTLLFFGSIVVAGGIMAMIDTDRNERKQLDDELAKWRNRGAL